MKKLVLMTIVLFLAACEATTSEVISTTSPDKRFEVKVSGVQKIAMDPYTTTIIITGHKQSDTLMTELYTSGITKETVLFNWQDNDNCLITLKQRDKDRVLQVRFSEDGNALKEIPQ